MRSPMSAYERPYFGTKVPVKNHREKKFLNA
jgi:hypothetical protein